MVRLNFNESRTNHGGTIGSKNQSKSKTFNCSGEIQEILQRGQTEDLRGRCPRHVRRRGARKRGPWFSSQGTFESLDAPRCIFPSFERISSGVVQFEFTTFISNHNL